MAADVGLPVDAASGAERAVEHASDRVAGVSGFAGHAECGPNLAQNLPFAHYHRFQAAGNPEQVEDAIGLPELIQMPFEFYARHTGICNQEVADPSRQAVIIRVIGVNPQLRLQVERITDCGTY